MSAKVARAAALLPPQRRKAEAPKKSLVAPAVRKLHRCDTTDITRDEPPRIKHELDARRLASRLHVTDMMAAETSVADTKRVKEKLTYGTRRADTSHPKRKSQVSFAEVLYLSIDNGCCPSHRRMSVHVVMQDNSMVNLIFYSDGISFQGWNSTR